MELVTCAVIQNKTWENEQVLKYRKFEGLKLCTIGEDSLEVTCNILPIELCNRVEVDLILRAQQYLLLVTFLEI